MEPLQGVGGDRPPINENQRGPIEGSTEDHQHSDETAGENQQETVEQRPVDKPKVSSSTCKPAATHMPEVELPAHRINARIQYMRDHALIGKFIGFWSNEKALRAWINVKWHPKGQIDLHLGPKGFFTAIFTCLEDRNRFFEGGGLLLQLSWLISQRMGSKIQPGQGRPELCTSLG